MLGYYIALAILLHYLLQARLMTSKNGGTKRRLKKRDATLWSNTPISRPTGKNNGNKNLKWCSIPCVINMNLSNTHSANLANAAYNSGLVPLGW